MKRKMRTIKVMAAIIRTNLDSKIKQIAILQSKRVEMKMAKIVIKLSLFNPTKVQSVGIIIDLVFTSKKHYFDCNEECK